jgi:plastocyanin
MKFGSSSLAIMAAAVATVEAVNHQVTVGLTGLNFSPNSVTAAVGDTIEFVVSGVRSPSRPFPGSFLFH